MNLRTYRGVHRLNKDEDGRVKCVACFMCSTACPARCIHIEAAESPWEDREKYPAKFDIDELRCIYCGMCEEACPVDAIELTHTYDIVGLTRQEMIFDKSKLLRVYDETIAARADVSLGGRLRRARLMPIECTVYFRQPGNTPIPAAGRLREVVHCCG